MWKLSQEGVREREISAITYISLKLYSSIWSKTLLQRLHQITICFFYHHVIDIISDWAANALEVYKNSNQVIQLTKTANLMKQPNISPTPSNISIFPLLKDIVHTPDMQHHLIKLCIEYMNTLNSQ